MFSLSDMVRMAVIVYARTQRERDRCLFGLGTGPTHFFLTQN